MKRPPEPNSALFARVPQPVYDAEPGFVELYFKAWELAARHVKHIADLPCPTYLD